MTFIVGYIYRDTVQIIADSAETYINLGKSKERRIITSFAEDSGDENLFPNGRLSPLFLQILLTSSICRLNCNWVNIGGIGGYVEVTPMQAGDPAVWLFKKHSQSNKIIDDLRQTQLILCALLFYPF